MNSEILEKKCAYDKSRYNAYVTGSEFEYLLKKRFGCRIKGHAINIQNNTLYMSIAITGKNYKLHKHMQQWHIPNKADVHDLKVAVRKFIDRVEADERS